MGSSEASCRPAGSLGGQPGQNASAYKREQTTAYWENDLSAQRGTHHRKDVAFALLKGVQQASASRLSHPPLVCVWTSDQCYACMKKDKIGKKRKK